MKRLDKLEKYILKALVIGLVQNPYGVECKTIKLILEAMESSPFEDADYQTIANYFTSNKTGVSRGYVTTRQVGPRKYLYLITEAGRNRAKGKISFTIDSEIKQPLLDATYMDSVKDEAPVFVNVPREEFYGHKNDRNSRFVDCDSKWGRDVKDNFSNRCAVTGAEYSLDSAHIIPRAVDSTIVNDRENGIGLRTDIHRLFENGYISFNFEDGLIMVSDSFNDSLSKYGLSERSKLYRLEDNMSKYLRRHNYGIFKGWDDSREDEG